MKTTKPKPNISLLRKIQKAILKYPDQLDMGDWFSANSSMGTKPGRCGTAACLAGWAVTIGKTNSLKPSKAAGVCLGYSAENEASVLLNVDVGHSDKLFYTCNWPRKFARRYAEARTTKQAAKAASDRISYFIKTGK